MDLDGDCIMRWGSGRLRGRE